MTRLGVAFLAALAASFARAQDDLSMRDALAARPPFKASLELTDVCRNRHLATPGWCPKPEQPAIEEDGGITVNTGDDVELELTVPLTWASGRRAFMIVAAESLEQPDPKPAFGTVVDFGVPGIQHFKFRVDRPGAFVLFEPYGRAVTGRFTVRP